MCRLKLLALLPVFSLAGVLAGCGSSRPIPLPPLQITTQSPLPSGLVNTAYNKTLSATGGVPPYAWKGSDAPPGLVLNIPGVLTGTPTTAGDYVLTILVTDSAPTPSTVNGQFHITVVAPLQITTTALPSGTLGLAYSATLAATGGISPYTWAIPQGSLPSGLTLNATSGLISGTPTASGTSSFTVQVSDNGTPPATANANLSIVINPAPARSAALYITDQTGYQIQGNGSLLLLASSPELLINSNFISPSPTLPLLFTQVVVGNPATNVLQSFLVNPDYSLTVYSSSAALPNTEDYGPSSVDPTGSNLYLPGFVDNGQTTGVLIYPANGSLQSLGTVAVPNLKSPFPRMVFTPDGTLAFISTCPTSGPGSILSYSRASNGTLTSAATYTLPGSRCALGLTVSLDGKYLAEWEYGPPGIVQVFRVATDGTLTPATLPFAVTLDSQGTPDGVADTIWDSSGSFLLLATYFQFFPENVAGGVVVLNFSGTSLTETVYPTGPPCNVIRRAASFVYVDGTCFPMSSLSCHTTWGFDFQNGQLTYLPGSPWTNNGTLLTYYGPSDMVIY